MSDRPAPVVHDDEPEEEGDDVFDAWGAMDDDEPDVDPFTAAVASPKPLSPAPSTSKAPATPYDDGGEPDFAGWLAAKSQSKVKNPLPKGLTKAASTNTVATRSTTTTAKPRTVVAPKKIDTKPKDEEIDDGWGDAWD
jgi:SCY1-like protein 1